MAMYQIEPWGDERADLREAFIASTQFNLTRPPKCRAFKPVEFLPNFDGPKRQTAAEMEYKLKIYAQAHNRNLESRNGQ